MRSIVSSQCVPAEAQVFQLKLYRIAPEEFLLSAKDRCSDSWWMVRNKHGRNVKTWMERDAAKFRSMEQHYGRTNHPKKETPLGQLEKVLRKLLRSATISMVKFDGIRYPSVLYFCSDDSMRVLCDLMKGNSIDLLMISSVFNTSNDARLYDLLPVCSRLTLAIHRQFEKDVEVEHEFLLQATARLEKLCIHSRKYYPAEHIVDSQIVDDAFLLQLLSAKCVCLQLLYFLPLLTAKGVFKAIEHTVHRNVPMSGFKIYISADEVGALEELLSGSLFPGPVWLKRSGTVTTTIRPPITQHITKLNIRVWRSDHRVALDYYKIMVSVTRTEFFDVRFFEVME